MDLPQAGATALQRAGLAPATAALILLISYDRIQRHPIEVSVVCAVGADIFQKIGLNVEYQAADWGTVLQRLAKPEPVEQGGWNAFHTYWSGLDQLNPAVNGSLRANGRAGGRGWPTSPQLEKLRDRWLVATSLGEQQQLADDIQRQVLFDVPYYWRMDGRLDNDRLYVGLNSIS